MFEYEMIQKRLKEAREELYLIHGDSPEAKQRTEELELNIVGLEEMADKMESRARDIMIEMGA
jgi:hypothetical protein